LKWQTEVCETHAATPSTKSLKSLHDRRSTLITSQLPIDQWHSYLGDRTVADAILDRVVHNSYRLILKGESMRRHKTIGNKSAPSKSKNS
jgi:DNA replication protein DnaC